MFVQIIYLTLENFLSVVDLHDGAIDLDSCHLSGFECHDQQAAM